MRERESQGQPAERLDAEKVAANLDAMHQSAANAGRAAVQSRASFGGFDLNKLYQAYLVITQLIPIVQELLKVIGAGGTVAVDTAQATKLRERAAALGITPAA